MVVDDKDDQSLEIKNLDQENQNDEIYQLSSVSIDPTQETQTLNHVERM